VAGVGFMREVADLHLPRPRLFSSDGSAKRAGALHVILVPMPKQPNGTPGKKPPAVGPFSFAPTRDVSISRRQFRLSPEG
jgi:hypothetical protein